MVPKKKYSFGNVLSARPGLNTPDTPRLVGIRPIDASVKVPAGSHLMPATGAIEASADLGHVTSAACSPTLSTAIGLALIKCGADRMGERLRLVNPLEGYETLVEIFSPHFVDPEGEKLRA